MTAAPTTTTQATATGWVLRIGSTAGIAGALLGMVSNLRRDRGQAARRGVGDGAARRLLLAEETFNFALAALFNFLFAGVTFIHPLRAGGVPGAGCTRAGWAGGVVAGIGSVAAGLLQAVVGEPTTLSRILTIIFPTVITLWLVDMNVLVLRRAASQERAAA